VISVALLAVLYYFVTFETTALATVPPASNVPIFSPQTPTPLPTAAPTPTSQPTVAGAAVTWDASIGALFKQRCGACHGSSGGYNVGTYIAAVEGGNTGTAIVPGDPDNSPLVALQEGAHPGKFTAEELQRIKDWITAGAPEK
jgi:mono/diheme cytochrome c family protein